MSTIRYKIPLTRLQWVAWILFFVQVFSSYFTSHITILPAMIQSACIMFGCMVIVYSNIYFLIPKFYKNGKKALYILTSLLFLTGITIIRMEVSDYIYFSFVSDMNPTDPTLIEYISLFTYNLVIFMGSIIIRLAIDYFRIRSRQDMLEKRTIESELNLLKTQVQPHFLFNTLNNIYYLANREAPGTAAQLAKLSNLMRYFVDEGSNKEVLVEAEFKFVCDYIDLEKMRMRYPLHLDIQLSGESAGVKIPPMLMIPLVENVFKHGINKRSRENSLKIHATVMPTQLTLEVTNKLNSEYRHKKNGTGLENLRSRLQYLYGSKFKLFTNEKEDHFIAYLQIPL